MASGGEREIDRVLIKPFIENFFGEGELAFDPDSVGMIILVRTFFGEVGVRDAVGAYFEAHCFDLFELIPGKRLVGMTNEIGADKEGRLISILA